MSGVAWGAQTMTCQDWVAEYNASRDRKIAVSFLAMGGYYGWLRRDAEFAKTKARDASGLDEWLTEYCSANPRKPLMDAVNDFATQP